MAKGFKKGGYNPLNFKVVAYATEEDLNAATPKENTIGVITAVPISTWTFSATEPTEPMEGMVWIYTGATSPVAFNALKKNGIQVFPVFAKQYIGGTWVEKTEKSWQNGEWSEWAIPVFTKGTLLDGCSLNIVANTVAATVEVSGTDIVFQSSGLASGNKGGGFYIDPAFYVTDRKKLYVDATITLTGTSRWFRFGMRGVSPSWADGTVSMAAQADVDFSGARKTYELDISALSDYMYLVFAGYAVGKATVVIHDIRIE